MSVPSTAALGRQSEGNSARSWATLIVGLALLIAALLLVLSGRLVGLQNDRNHQQLLPTEVAGAGTVSGQLTLTNSGLLPIEISLEPRLNDGRTPATFPEYVSLTVTGRDQQLLYDGGLRTTTGPLLVLRPGDSVRLQVKVASTGRATDAPVAIPYSYYWIARAAMPWWWWVPAALGALLLLLVGYLRPWDRNGR